MSYFRTAILLAGLTALFMGIGFLMGGQTGMIIAFVIAAGMNLFSYWNSDKMVLRMYGAREVDARTSPKLYDMVQQLAGNAGLPMPKVYVMENPQPNAFATGRSPKHAAVAVTGGILQLMTNEELEGVLAHELAHVRNRDILIGTIAATMAAALSIFARMAMWGALGGRRNNNSPLGGIVALISIILAPLAAMVIKLAITRAREYQADRTGADITGQPLALASALQKLEAGTTRIPMNVNPAVAPLYIADPLKAFGGKRDGGGTLRKLFATHPPIPDRVARLEEMASPFS